VLDAVYPVQILRLARETVLASWSMAKVRHPGRTSAHVALLLVTTACAARTVPETEAQGALIGQACDSLREVASAQAPQAIYLEIADVRSPLFTPLKKYLAAQAVETQQVGALLLRDGQVAEAPWWYCADAACTNADTATLRVRTTRFPKSGSDALELALELGAPEAEAARWSITTKDQHPAVAPAGSAVLPATRIVVTPYYLADPQAESRRLLANCQARTR
jgi:hypothetical protein